MNGLSALLVFGEGVFCLDFVFVLSVLSYEKEFQILYAQLCSQPDI